MSKATELEECSNSNPRLSVSASESMSGGFAVINEKLIIEYYQIFAVLGPSLPITEKHSLCGCFQTQSARCTLTVFESCQ